MENHKEFFYPPLTGEVVNSVFTAGTVIINCPYKYTKGLKDFIRVGDLVRCTSILDDKIETELGIIDFIKGCFVLVIENVEESDGLMLHDYFSELEKIEHPNEKECSFRDDFIKKRFMK